MKNSIWTKWLSGFRQTINSPTPRKVNSALRRCCNLWPGEIPTAAIAADVLQAITELRHSKCWGRLEHEAELMKHLHWQAEELAIDCLDPKVEKDLFGEIPGQSNPAPEALGILEAFGAYAIKALTEKIAGEKKHHLRQNGGFEILGEVGRLPQLVHFRDQVVEIAREMIRARNEQSGVSAAQFVISSFLSRGLAVPVDILAEIVAFESTCQDEDTVRSLNILLVELGERDELTALVRMEELTD